MKKILLTMFVIMSMGFYVPNAWAANTAVLLNCQKYQYGCSWGDVPIERADLTKEEYAQARIQYEAEVTARRAANAAVNPPKTSTDSNTQTVIVKVIREDAPVAVTEPTKPEQDDVDVEAEQEQTIQKRTFLQSVKHVFLMTFSQKYRNLQKGFVTVDTWDCPEDYPIKANIRSGIYHTYDSQYYDRTSARNSECFDIEINAIEQGYRAPFN